MKIINRIFDAVTIALFVCMVVIVLLQIVFRYVLKISVPWTEELSRLLFIYVGFFATALAARENQFIVVDVLVKRLPDKVQAVLWVITKIVVITFFSIMWVGAVMMFQTTKSTYYQSMPGVSKGMSYMAVIIGAGMTIIYTLIQSIYTIRKRRQEEC